MIDFEPTPEQRALVEGVRRLVRTKIVPLEVELDPDASHLPQRVHEELVALVDQMGLRAWDAPESMGGPGLDTVTRVLLAIEMSQHRAGLYAPCYGVFGGAGLAHLYEAREDQRAQYLYPSLRGERRGFFALSEPSGGSDPARALRTTAVRDGGDWILNGSKLWISGALDADFGIVMARTGAGRGGITAFIVDGDSPGFEIKRIVHTLRSSAPATELVFDNVRVPDRNRLGEVGRGFELASARLVQQRIPYAASCVGVAIAAHDLAVAYAKDRAVFGARLADHQGIQWMLVDNEIDIRTSRLLVLDAAARADAGLDVRTESSACKIVATEAASRVIDRAMQIHGGLGMAKEMPFERWYREIRIRRIGEGPTEVQRMIIARELLGTRESRSRQ